MSFSFFHYTIIYSSFRLNSYYAHNSRSFGPVAFAVIFSMGVVNMWKYDDPTVESDIGQRNQLNDVVVSPPVTSDNIIVISLKNKVRLLIYLVLEIKSFCKKGIFFL